ncbi:MAG TPA: NAD-dependent epimerase/dehydratase family protein [Anaeromyxobacteraceae bacterium]|jgi:nucleoside-diphosphate-sugar epimerase|nr:NAD-dependent epimerase/dehydratase family protein [Anaeromyxobacteraceae bacterium]
MHVLIAGCGWLGQAVAAALLARGDRVTGVRRDPGHAAALASLGITPLAADLADPASLALLPGDLEAVVACQSSSADGAAPYRAAYVSANETLLALARRRPLRGLVYTGSTGVFGQGGGGDVDEATPPAPASPAAEVLVEAERLVLGAAPAVPARVVRLSGLYGPGRTGIFSRVRSGALALGPSDGAWMNFCHRDDAVKAVLAALDRGRDGAVYHGSDARPARRREVVEWLAQRLGVAPARQADGAKPAPGPDRRILAERTRAELGFTLSYPSFREGLEPLLPA